MHDEPQSVTEVEIDNRQLTAEEIEDEQQWDAQFTRSQDALVKLADEVLADIRAGRTEPFDPDTL